MQTEKIHGTEKPGNGRDGPGTGSPLEKEWMTVEELGRLLGLKKTARYWLLHKGYFQSKVIGGKTWVDVQSFEDWYANQRSYRKADWEAPWKGQKQRSYSVREFAGMLGITDQAAYSLIKKDGIRTILVDGETKILQETFADWYAGQDRYCMEEGRAEDADVENTTVTMPEMARLLGISRKQVYGILKCRQYGDILETVVAAGRRRVTRESFEKFLPSQDRFHLASAGSPPAEEAETEDPGNLEEPGPEGEAASGNLDAAGPDASFLTMSMAAEMAGISRQAVSKALGRGCFPGIKQSGIIRIPREGFEAWLESRKNEVNYGNNQKA